MNQHLLNTLYVASTALRTGGGHLKDRGTISVLETPSGWGDKGNAHTHTWREQQRLVLREHLTRARLFEVSSQVVTYLNPQNHPMKKALLLPLIYR